MRPEPATWPQSLKAWLWWGGGEEEGVDGNDEDEDIH